MDVRNPNSLLDDLKASSPVSNDEEFRRKIQALIKSRERLKKQNAELTARVAELENAATANAVSESLSAPALPDPGWEMRAAELANEVQRLNAAMAEQSVQLETAYRECERLRGFTAYAAPAPVSDAEMSRRFGQAFLEAQAGARRLAREAELERDAVRAETADTARAMVAEIEGAKADLQSMQTCMTGLLTAFGSRMETLNGMLNGAERHFQSRAEQKE